MITGFFIPLQTLENVGGITPANIEFVLADLMTVPFSDAFLGTSLGCAAVAAQ